MYILVNMSDVFNVMIVFLQFFCILRGMPGCRVEDLEDFEEDFEEIFFIFSVCENDKKRMNGRV